VTPAPPRLAERGLRLLEPDADWRDAILGDLREEFPIMAERHGAPYARRWYWAHALGIALHRAGSRLTPGRRRHALPFTEPPEPRASRVSLLLHDVRAAWRSVGHGVIAIVSGLLSAVGIYSLLSFLTGRRAREMGVRMALGATRGDVVRLACGQAARLIGAAWRSAWSARISWVEGSKRRCSGDHRQSRWQAALRWRSA
jgi:hypothetical protein